jgi:hypothetical protein
MKYRPEKPLLILAPALVGMWLGGWYAGYPRSEIMLASIMFMLLALLTDPRMVISVRPVEPPAPLRDYFIIEWACYALRVAGSYVERGEQLELERLGFCDLATARALVEQYEDRPKPTVRDGYPCEYVITLSVVHAASVDEAMKRAWTAVLHRTPWEKLSERRREARQVLEERQHEAAAG